MGKVYTVVTPEGISCQTKVLHSRTTKPSNYRMVTLENTFNMHFVIANCTTCVLSGHTHACVHPQTKIGPP